MAVRLWAFFLLGFHLAACFPYGWLVRQLGGLPPIFFPSLFLWSRCRSMVLGRDSAEVLPSGWFPLAVFLGVSCLCSGGGGFGWLNLAGPYVLRDVFPGACLLLSSSPLALHGVVSTSPVCLSRAPAFRQVRVAMLAEGSVNCPRSWCWLSIRLSSWWKGRLMGQRLVIVPLPWTAVFVHSVFSCDLSLRRYLSWGRGLFFLLCLSVYCRTWWRLSSWKLVGIPVGFTSSSPLLGGVLFDLVPILSWVFSPGFGRGFSPSLGWFDTGLVFCCFLAPRG